MKKKSVQQMAEWTNENINQHQRISLKKTNLVQSCTVNLYELYEYYIVLEIINYKYIFKKNINI